MSAEQESVQIKGSMKRELDAGGNPRKKRHQVMRGDDYKDLVLKMYDSGKRKAEISRDLGIPESTIRGWLKKMKPEVDERNVPEKPNVPDEPTVPKKSNIPAINSITRDDLQDWFNKQRDIIRGNILPDCY